MKNHLFVFSPGKWIGEGTISLNQLEEDLPFYTRWQIKAEDQGLIECIQEIQVKGLSDIMVNHFVFSDFSLRGFSLEMDNHALGKVKGLGLITDKQVGWEFRSESLGFEGYENYEKSSSDLYTMSGEFSSQDQLRTVISGKIWKPVSS